MRLPRPGDDLGGAHGPWRSTGRRARTIQPPARSAVPVLHAGGDQGFVLRRTRRRTRSGARAAAGIWQCGDEALATRCRRWRRAESC
jgi:hypothetical protein